MNSITRSLLIGALAVLATQAARADLALAQKKNCMACHAVDKKVVGPAFKDVAAKYAKDKKAADMLADKIVKGGKGSWGEVPMPPNPQVSADEAKKLVAWVLATK
ncbi:cytochrome c [Inhella inkyongensis]|uniref:Cytochrome c n=1 Tax=Inhella inkyongensis TaxID=392593 RepID=A0A840S482_9BURK|nr:c-type cytochrome [Inhella inkyongensis]MBB5206087.1 cytochrome c [Inhella inkyongensis]